ncbi:amino acid/amide ABC transporter membrane protein 1 (HAAT family) [Hydrogenispora ethanolica]|jgi:branched-chain amino acid transport system permease protein|uniref:Amino acid/amide ABC transporter membrane protein 1 (HAAT family) n=1 Tax=Hydrogenispora ethanolica TaxID=1082276 RepID=A0A4R1RB35_HYDET|nr:branched-chain amino acid ABC transporter permease [Hydrogenispora ethanolica]TCL62981.1 amino acid/amide ABC transporter membrane protein 1 (HAAT family) [Hydrogenispora ethanolica]
MFWQQLINGLTLGFTYALIALGYTMVYGIIQLINFAHGEIFMMGAFFALLLVTVFQLNIFVAMILAMAFCMLLGVIIEFVAYRPLRKSGRLSALISAIGVSIFLSTLALLLFGADAKGFPDNSFPVTQFKIGSATVSSLQLLIFGVSSFLMLALEFIVHKTKLGKAMRATSQDYNTAALMGINVNWIISFTFALGSSLAAAGGVLVGLYFNAVNWNMGLMAGLKAFAAAVLGGIGSIPGAMLGGVFLGVAEVFGVAAGFSSFRDAIAFAILVLVLFIKPTGFFGLKIQKKV